MEKNKTNLAQLAEQVQTHLPSQGAERGGAQCDARAAGQGADLAQQRRGRTLVQIQEATRTAGVGFERQIKAANESLETTIIATGQATVELNRAAGNLSWVRYGLTVMSGLGAAALRVLGLAQHAERAADRGLSSGGRGARAGAAGPGRLLTVSAEQQPAKCRGFAFANAHAVPQQSVRAGQLHSPERPNGSVARTDLLIQESDLLLCSQL